MVKIHFIDNSDDRVIAKKNASVIPRVGDELRFGGPDNERYYRVILVVFVYDEDVERVNIGCELCA